MPDTRKAVGAGNRWDPGAGRTQDVQEESCVDTYHSRRLCTASSLQDPTRDIEAGDSIALSATTLLGHC